MIQKRIGIFGGSFNPIHNSHLKVANYLIEKKVLDEVWIIPCKNHVFNKSLIPAKERLRMIELAIKGKRSIKAHKVEMKMKGKSCTIKTLRKLKKDYPHDFFIIIGADILKDIIKWYNFQELRKEAKFIVFKRKGYKIKNPGINIEKVIAAHADAISSTKIRTRISEGKKITKWVPKPVENYILKNKLYTK